MNFVVLELTGKDIENMQNPKNYFWKKVSKKFLYPCDK
jgi:hypothetical protein